MRLAPLLLAAVFLAGCTSAPMAPPREERLDAWPAWDVGDSWTWHVRSRGSDAGFVEGQVQGTVLVVGATTYGVRTEDNEGLKVDQDFWRSNMTPTSSRSETFRLPLVPGASWSSASFRYRVVGPEEVQTPAGKFVAWRINATEDSQRPTGWRDDWWSPEAKIWVKSRQTRLVSTGHVAIERELQAYHLVQGSS